MIRQIDSPQSLKSQDIIDLDQHFERFRKHVIGIDTHFLTPYGIKPLVYADWTASGRLYRPIERRLSEELGSYVGNTHTETTLTGSCMTKAYHEARNIIKKHTGAAESDILIATGSGMTGAINKFQRILGLKVHERYADQINIPPDDRPVIFVTHMEHHSNQTSWMETVAEVVIIPCTDDGLVDIHGFETMLQAYHRRRHKIAAVTCCSNVTGIMTPFYEIARIIHHAGGLCFVDFACSAPYIDIDMRSNDTETRLDAIYFSPHKFLGGPGSAGILIFRKELYGNSVPDHPGGGTVWWTDPWGKRSYIQEIEEREDGGTPAFLQTIKIALAIRLKEEMGTSNIHRKEKLLLSRLWERFAKIPEIQVLAAQHKDRLPVVSFYIPGLHFNLAVRLLNDRFGIQVRGGCSCAGTYGHYLLSISYEISNAIFKNVEQGILSAKAGWIRLSLHPVMTLDEVDYIADALEELVANHEAWIKDYVYIPSTNEWVHRADVSSEDDLVHDWLSSPLTV